VTRQVRLEDWPVSPCESVSFTLQPDGFFDRNPCVGPVNPEASAAAAAAAAASASANAAAPAGPSSSGEVDDELRSKL
jgi:hypothetical protein